MEEDLKFAIDYLFRTTANDYGKIMMLVLGKMRPDINTYASFNLKEFFVEVVPNKKWELQKEEMPYSYPEVLVDLVCKYSHEKEHATIEKFIVENLNDIEEKAKYLHEKLPIKNLTLNDLNEIEKKVERYSSIPLQHMKYFYDLLDIKSDRVCFKKSVEEIIWLKFLNKKIREYKGDFDVD